MIPDFGGFLVKANSEGQPGPMDFGRTHADGANMLAKALKPFGGIVMWRAFVYSPSDPDRAKQAYIEFKDLDGKFMDNVIIQIKNGPIDFQPREPYSPLFGAMPETQEMAELQITQEYLGHSNHICFLGTMWEEFLNDIKKYANYTNNLRGYKYRAIAGVANVGDDANFCGNTVAQSNWYAFGRLAWNSNLTSREIAREWVAQEIGKDNTAGQKITFDRTKYNTTVINSYGSDGLPNTDDDLTQTYQFDEYGRTVSVKAKTADRDLGATAFEYTDGAVNADASNTFPPLPDASSILHAVPAD